MTHDAIPTLDKTFKKTLQRCVSSGNGGATLLLLSTLVGDIIDRTARLKGM